MPSIVFRPDPGVWRTVLASIGDRPEGRPGVVDESRAALVVTTLPDDRPHETDYIRTVLRWSERIGAECPVIGWDLRGERLVVRIEPTGPIVRFRRLVEEAADVFGWLPDPFDPVMTVASNGTKRPETPFPFRRIVLRGPDIDEA